MLSGILLLVVVFALIFEFINGFHDTANAIATSVYTRALTARRAIILAGTMNFLGALASEKVAMTISKGLVNVQLEQYVILAALIAAIIWNLFTWWSCIPSSSSHALIGGLLGATIVYSSSLQNIMWTGVFQKIIIPLVTSPLIGFLMGFLWMSFFGAPVSTTQVITSAVMGAGTAKRASAVKWGIAKGIVVAWVVTLPITMILGGTIVYIMNLFM